MSGARARRAAGDTGVRRAGAPPGATSAAIAALTALAWHNRFVQDDAFISFRYARNLAQGQGFVWNPGERVEGYTNFLWTLVMAIPFRLGLDPIVFSQALGLILFPATLLATARIAAHVVPGSRWAPLVAVVLLGTNYTFSAYATGGLETQLHALLIAAVVLVAVRAIQRNAVPRSAECAGASLAAGAALLTRMDSALPIAVSYAFLGAELLRARRSDRPGVWRAALWLVLPGAAIVSIWLGWKLAYYGDVLPNTYYAKMIPLSQAWLPGTRFVFVFLKSYWLLPLLVFVAALGWRARSRWGRPQSLLLLLVLSWTVYVVRIGGDFMEFRALVAALPAAFVLLTWLLLRVCPWRSASLAAGALVLAGSFAHARSFEHAYAIESISLLRDHIESERYGWADAGRALGERFGASATSADPVVIATGAAGAVPYYSGLRAVDSRGLSDPWVARHGLRTDPRYASPGHHRVAPVAYLVERGVNLVIGHPWVTRQRPGGRRPVFDRSALGRLGLPASGLDALPLDARPTVLEIPLDASRRLWVVYLVPHALVDAAIRREGLRTYPLSLR